MVKRLSSPHALCCGRPATGRPRRSTPTSLPSPQAEDISARTAPQRREEHPRKGHGAPDHEGEESQPE